jgi:hypothetical protein
MKATPPQYFTLLQQIFTKKRRAVDARNINDSEILAERHIQYHLAMMMVRKTFLSIVNQ